MSAIRVRKSSNAWEMLATSLVLYTKHAFLRASPSNPHLFVVNGEIHLPSEVLREVVLVGGVAHGDLVKSVPHQKETGVQRGKLVIRR